MDIYAEIMELKKQGSACAVATIVQSIGSSPQKEGAKMLVRADGSTAGTIGGGCLEAEVIQLALTAMQAGSSSTVPFDLTERQGGLVCGGKVLVYIEPVVPEPRIVILGAGHIGKALSTLARFAGFEVTVADDREEYANRRNLPDAHRVVVSEYGVVFSAVPVCRSASIVIATRGHNHDFEALKAALATDAGYIGLVGSARKKTILFKTLREAGLPESAVARTIIPVGLPIGSVTPEEIAVSIIAQIIRQRRSNAARSIGGPSCSRLVPADGAVEAASSS